MHAVGSRALRPRLYFYLRQAKRGDEIVILVHGQPAALLRAVRPTDAGPFVPMLYVRDELHKAIAMARTHSIVVTRYSQVLAVLDRAPEGLDSELWEFAS